MPADGLQFAALLERIGWTEGELAERLGVSPGTVSSWRRGRRTPPETGIAWLERVADGVERAGALPEHWERVALRIGEQSMTPAEFSAALARLGLTQSELGRQLAATREGAKATTWQRAVRAWASGERRVPVEMAWALDRLLAHSTEAPRPCP